MNARVGLAPFRGARANTHDDGVHYVSTYLRSLSEALHALGHDSSALVARLDLDPARLDADNEWFSLAEVDAIIRAAVAITGDAALGLHWGERTPMIQFNLRPNVIGTAPSLREALDAIVQVQFEVVNMAQCFFIEEGVRSTVSLDLHAISDVGQRAMTELALLSLLRCFRSLGHSRAIRRINVGYARPAYGAEYDRLFGAKLRFDKPRTNVEFASAALDRRTAKR